VLANLRARRHLSGNKAFSRAEEFTMTASSGLHHVTAIAGDPRRNADFHTRTLGLRMVKKTVNFDDPGTYHLYYGDAAGSPGSIITFFPWPGASPGRAGLGQAVETAYLIPEGSVSFWVGRLVALGVPHQAPVRRFGRTVISFRDPDGMHLELVGDPAAAGMPGHAGGDVPAEHAIRGFAGVTLWVADPAPTARVLTEAFGYRAAGEDDGRHRYTASGDGLGLWVDLRVAPGFLRGASGAGTIHHVAFRARDDEQQAAMVQALAGLGLRATEQVDRNYFRSVYFREPGGVLFEIATDAPGFAVDEMPDSLGSKLMLPPWLEPHRAQVEAALPPLA
jgi:glyoxalase family protein